MSYVDFTVRMKRKPEYWIAFVLLPSIFLVALSYGTFWIQRGAIPARAAFCFIAYLSIINLTKGALASLPRISRRRPSCVRTRRLPDSKIRESFRPGSGRSRPTSAGIGGSRGRGKIEPESRSSSV